MKKWPEIISNGTVMVIERFYESQVEKIPASHDLVSANIYKILHTGIISLTAVFRFPFYRFYPWDVSHSDILGTGKYSCRS